MSPIHAVQIGSVQHNRSVEEASPLRLAVLLAVMLVATGTLVGFTPALLTANPSRSDTVLSVPPWFWISVLALVASVLCLICWFLWTRIQRERAERRAIHESMASHRELAEKQIAELKTVSSLGMLLDLNQGQIDEYHRIATYQADRSFRSSQRAMWIGLLVIVACFVAGLYLPTAEAKVFVGALAAVGAALSGFLNRTYLHMYRQTLGQLNRYFDQPVLTSYYLTAERLTEDLPDDQRHEMRRSIIGQVLQTSTQLIGSPNGEQPAARTSRRERPAAPEPDQG